LTSNKTQTAYINDVSVFAYFVVDTTPDFVGSSGVSHLEVPITSTWLSGLCLANGDTSPVSNFQRPFYACPQSYIGYRIQSYYTGRAGAYNQVRVQKIDIAEIMLELWGVMKGVNDVFGQNPVGTQPAPFDPTDPNNYYDLLEILFREAVAIAAFNESPVTVGYQDPYVNYTCLPWGMQFLMPDSGFSNYLNFPQIVVENLRRLKFVGEFYMGVPTYIFNVFMSSTVDLNYKIWNVARATPPAFSWLTMSNGGTYYNYNIYASGGAATTIGGFVDQWNSVCVRLGQGYSTFCPSTAQTEKSLLRAPKNFQKNPVAQLTWFVRGVVNSVGVQTNVAKWKQDLLVSWESQLIVGSRHVKPLTKQADGKFPNMFTLGGASPGIIFRRPYHDDQSGFLGMVLPLAYVDPNVTAANSSLAVIMSRQMGTTYQNSNTGTAVYYVKLFTTGSQQAHAINANVANNELAQLFTNNSNMGLGGALGEFASWIGSKVGKKTSKIG